MAALKKGSVALMLALLLAVSISAPVANAQVPSLELGVITCQAVAVPPVVRAEGIAELVGDIVSTCQNIPPAVPIGNFQAYLETNVSVSLNVNVTNNIDFGDGETITDSVLVVNENNCGDPEEVQTFDGCGAVNTTIQDPQHGNLAAANRLEWNEISFPIPGTPINAPGPIADCSGQIGVENGCHPFTTTLRITNIRGNASQLGVPNSASFPSTQITAFVSITGPNTIPVNNNVLNVAVPILGLRVTTDGGDAGLQCVDGEEHAIITLEEGFATAFKILGLPTFIPGNTQWEDGYYTLGSGANDGGASQGTRFIINFTNIPAGGELTVFDNIDCWNADDPDDVDSDLLRLQLVDGTDSAGAGGKPVGTADDPEDTTEVSLSGGAGFVVYEVTEADPFANEDCEVGLWFKWETDTTNDLPGIGIGQATASFAPTSTVTTADESAPEPRFVDNSGDPEDIFEIIRCTTTLLFPFVTNQANFDTGIAISNTSRDWLGTDPQDGTCTLHYHGSGVGGSAAPVDQTSTVLAAGEQLIFTLSSGNAAQGIAGAPEFQGYIIAQCEFQYGHGFAFITDGFGGVPALAQGYLALVIPVTPNDGRIAGVPQGSGALHLFGEALNH